MYKLCALLAVSLFVVSCIPSINEYIELEEYYKAFMYMKI